MGRREAFDPIKQYVANRTFAFGARTYMEGDPFNERDDMRRLRQLYDSRYLRMAAEQTDAPDFKSMPDDMLKDWLADHGFANLAHPRSPHVRLVERCMRVWRDLQTAPPSLNGATKAPSNGATAPPRERLTARPTTERVRL